MLEDALWISPPADPGDGAVAFRRRFPGRPGRKATLTLTCLGVYDAYLNGQRVGDCLLAPGCTEYEKRLQAQTYDISDMIRAENELTVTVAKGWHRSRMMRKRERLYSAPCALIARLDMDGEVLVTDSAWEAGPSSVVFSDIWDGEACDATMDTTAYGPVRTVDWPRDVIVPQEGPYVREQETLSPRALFVTPRGERVIDFGQEITGYAEITLTARRGDRVVLTCAEMLDRDGNFYNENYRTAQSRMTYICRDGQQTWKPRFTFFGFRYLRVDEWPGEPRMDSIRAIAVYSEMARTGFLRTTHAKLNRLIENTLWSQRGNFVDIPTDCPQRDERMGWTGDAQVFCKAACYHYNTQRFFEKWMNDLRASQRPDGSIPDTVPNFWGIRRSSAAWGDVMTVLPWQVFLMYGDRGTLARNVDAMKRWVDYITADTLERDLWIGPDDADIMWQKHYGDWLALDAAEGSYHGATPNDLIASAYYARSTLLLVKAGKALGRDMAAYEVLYERIRAAFRDRFDLTTQTACVLALAFDLTDDRPAVAARLNRMIRDNGTRLSTGFVGTPHLLYALSDNGYAGTAYDLLLQEAYPSWLYEVDHGATTIWEHWDGRKENGTFWSADMNSFNHYAYGAVADWLYAVAGGIRPDEDAPGFERVVIAPVPSGRIQGFEAEYRSVRGTILSRWTNTEEGVRHEISTPVPADIILDGERHPVGPGTYIFYDQRKEQ